MGEVSEEDLYKNESYQQLKFGQFFDDDYEPNCSREENELMNEITKIWTIFCILSCFLEVLSC